MSLDRLKVFYVVAKEGSLASAAKKLHIAQPALSRTIKLLEEELGTQLFERMSKLGLRLTLQGERTLEFTEKILNESELFEKIIKENTDKPQGELKIVTTPAMASFWLAQFLPGFIEKYPEIRLDIIGETSAIEGTPEKGDVFIRTYIDHHPYLIQRHLQSFHHKLWASLEYLEKYGTPQKIEDLNHHQLLTYEKTGYNIYANTTWILDIGENRDKPRKPSLTFNSIEGLINYADAGLGIIGMPIELVKLKSKKLINILEDVNGPIIDIYCIYPESRKDSKKIASFVDYLEDAIKGAENK